MNAQHTPTPCNAKEAREHKRLLRKWALGKATRTEMLRCMELDRKAPGVNALIARTIFVGTAALAAAGEGA